MHRENGFLLFLKQKCRQISGVLGFNGFLMKSLTLEAYEDRLGGPYIGY
jgi:hypothetical protein